MLRWVWLSFGSLGATPNADLSLPDRERTPDRVGYPADSWSWGNRFLATVWPSVALKEWPLSFSAKHPSCYQIESALPTELAIQRIHGHGGTDSWLRSGRAWRSRNGRCRSLRNIPAATRSRAHSRPSWLSSGFMVMGEQILGYGLAERGAQGMAAVVLCETSQPPPNALINWTLAVICCIRRFIAVP